MSECIGCTGGEDSFLHSTFDVPRISANAQTVDVSALPKNEFDPLFALAAVDGGGHIDKAEFRRFVTRLPGVTLTNEEMLQLFHEVDRGIPSHLEKEAFREVMRRIETTATVQEAVEIFMEERAKRRADLDHQSFRSNDLSLTLQRQASDIHTQSFALMRQPSVLASLTSPFTSPIKSAMDMFGSPRSQARATPPRKSSNCQLSSVLQNSFQTLTPRGQVHEGAQLLVEVKCGYDMPIADLYSSDPFVVLTVGNTVLKTKVCGSTLNPVWNETLLFPITSDLGLLRVTVMDKDIWGSGLMCSFDPIPIQILPRGVAQEFVLEASEVHCKPSKSGVLPTLVMKVKACGFGTMDTANVEVQESREREKVQCTEMVEQRDLCVKAVHEVQQCWRAEVESMCRQQSEMQETMQSKLNAYCQELAAVSGALQADADIQEDCARELASALQVCQEKLAIEQQSHASVRQLLETEQASRAAQQRAFDEVQALLVDEREAHQATLKAVSEHTTTGAVMAATIAELQEQVAQLEGAMASLASQQSGLQEFQDALTAEKESLTRTLDKELRAHGETECALLECKEQLTKARQQQRELLEAEEAANAATQKVIAELQGQLEAEKTAQKEALLAVQERSAESFVMVSSIAELEHQLESSVATLVAEQRAREECCEQFAAEKERHSFSLETERQAHAETASALQAMKERLSVEQHRQAEAQQLLVAGQGAHTAAQQALAELREQVAAFEKEMQLRAETASALQGKLSMEQQAHAEVRELLESVQAANAAAQRALEDVQEQLATEKRTHTCALEKEKEAHSETASALQACREQLLVEQRASEEIRQLLESVQEANAAMRQALAEVQDQLASEQAAHTCALKREVEAHSETSLALQACKEQLLVEQQCQAEVRQLLEMEHAAHGAAQRALAEVQEQVAAGNATHALALEKERQAHCETASSLQACQEQLSAEQQVRADTRQQLETEQATNAAAQKELAELQAQLAAEQKAHQDTITALQEVTAEGCAMAGTNGDLEHQLEESKECLASERRASQDALACLQDKFDAEKAAHCETASAWQICKEQLLELAAEKEAQALALEQAKEAQSEAASALQGLQDELSTKQQANAEVQQLLEGEQTANAATQKALAEVQEELAAEKEAHAALYKTARTSEQEAEKLSSDIAALRTELVSKQEATRHLQSLIASLEGRLQDASAAAASTCATNAAALGHAAEAQSRTEAELHDSQKQLRSADAEILDLKHQLVQVRDRILDVQNALEGEKAAHQFSVEAFEDERQEHALTQQELAVKTRELSATLASLEETDESLAEARQAQAATQARLLQEEEVRGSLEVALQDMERRLMGDDVKEDTPGDKENKENKPKGKLPNGVNKIVAKAKSGANTLTPDRKVLSARGAPAPLRLSTVGAGKTVSKGPTTPTTAPAKSSALNKKKTKASKAKPDSARGLEGAFGDAAEENACPLFEVTDVLSTITNTALSKTLSGTAKSPTPHSPDTFSDPIKPLRHPGSPQALAKALAAQDVHPSPCTHETAALGVEETQARDQLATQSDVEFLALVTGAMHSLRHIQSQSAAELAERKAVQEKHGRLRRYRKALLRTVARVIVQKRSQQDVWRFLSSTTSHQRQYELGRVLEGYAQTTADTGKALAKDCEAHRQRVAAKVRAKKERKGLSMSLNSSVNEGPGSPLGSPLTSPVGSPLTSPRKASLLWRHASASVLRSPKTSLKCRLQEIVRHAVEARGAAVEGAMRDLKQQSAALDHVCATDQARQYNTAEQQLKEKRKHDELLRYLLETYGVQGYRVDAPNSWYGSLAVQLRNAVETQKRLQASLAEYEEQDSLSEYEDDFSSADPSAPASGVLTEAFSPRSNLCFVTNAYTPRDNSVFSTPRPEVGDLD